MAKEYEVTIPITGYVFVTVQADDEEEAIYIAFSTAGTQDIQEWDFHKVVVEGNVFHGLMNPMEIVCVNDDDIE